MTLPAGLTDVVASWRARAGELRAWGAAGNADTLERAVRELEAALAHDVEAELSLAEAALRSGYNPDSLRRMVREGKLRAQHRGRRLVFRAGDLPRKATYVDAPDIPPYDPGADARRVAGRRHGG